MTTPTTISPEEMLQNLRQVKSDLEQTCNEAIRMGEFRLKEYNANPSDEAKEKVKRWHDLAESSLRQSQAVEKSIAILEVLTHPDFYRAEDFGRPVGREDGAQAYVSLQRLHSTDKRGYWGATILEAILSAHREILTRQGASPEKEGAAQ